MHTLKITFFFTIGMLTGISCMYVAMNNVEPIIYAEECVPAI